MDIIIGNEGQQGIEFRVTVRKVNSVLYVKRKSLRTALNLPPVSTSRHAQLRASNVPQEKLGGSFVWYSVSNAIEYLDTIHSKTKYLTRLLMMNIAIELQEFNKE